ncbi:LURP-one-related/scramblase family protein [Chloroflexota bacterium]
MGRKKRRDRRQARRGQAPVFKRYQMHQKLVALGDDFYIENEQGEKVFKVDGKVLRIRDTLIFKDMQGSKLCEIQEQLLRIKDTMKIEGPDGKTLATVKKALITPVRDRWTVKIKGGPNLDVQGNILDHEYRIEEGRHKVAEVSKKWFRIRDTYGVEVAEGQDDVLILAITVAIDIMAHPTR